MMPQAEQLLLSLQARPPARLSDFAGPSHAGVLAAVQELLQTPAGLLYVHGAAGSGRSHLLAAICAAQEEAGGRTLLLPLASVREESPDLLASLGEPALLACDDVDAIAGQPAWEEALFHLYNRVRAAGGRLVFTAVQPARHCGLQLPDLASRLAQAPAWELGLPDDASREALWQAAAARRGMVLAADVLACLVQRGPRQAGAMRALLDRLDHLSLQQGRRLTLPFVRQVLETWRGPEFPA